MVIYSNLKVSIFSVWVYIIVQIKESFVTRINMNYMREFWSRLNEKMAFYTKGLLIAGKETSGLLQNVEIQEFCEKC